MPTTAERCVIARQTVEAKGDVLPAGFEYRCPAYAYGHWGVTSGAPGAPHFVEINVSKIGPSDAKLDYVVAHEFCHARAAVGLEQYTWTDEGTTDQCAANYGFPNVYFARTGKDSDNDFLTTITPHETTSLLMVAAVIVLVAIAAAICGFVWRRTRPRQPTVQINVQGDVSVEDRLKGHSEE